MLDQCLEGIELEVVSIEEAVANTVDFDKLAIAKVAIEDFKLVVHIEEEQEASIMDLANHLEAYTLEEALANPGQPNSHSNTTTTVLLDLALEAATSRKLIKVLKVQKLISKVPLMVIINTY